MPLQLLKFCFLAPVFGFEALGACFLVVQVAVSIWFLDLLEKQIEPFLKHFAIFCYYLAILLPKKTIPDVFCGACLGLETGFLGVLERLRKARFGLDWRKKAAIYALASLLLLFFAYVVGCWFGFKLKGPRSESRR